MLHRLGSALLVNLCLISLTTATESNHQPPNIVVIIADDVGWNDLSFHGSDQISTPNIDALGYNGVFLERHYSMQVCTPSRAAFLTGQYPIRLGYHGYPLALGLNRSISKEFTTLPQRLKKLGYKTHLVGKWHLGHAKKEHTPLGYGYDTHFGYWNGYIGYFDHSVGSFDKYNGTDLHDQLVPVTELVGEYITDLLTARSLEIIQQHDVKCPLYLVISHLAGHTGKTLRGIETTLEVHNITATNEKYGFIENVQRRMYAEIIERMDVSVGQVIQSLAKKQILQNTIIVFFSDNGAPTYGIHQNFGSNYPLRGIKMTMYEGAIRTPAILFAPQLRDKGRVWPNLFHITDWVPTLYTAAGGELRDLGLIDGVDQWHSLLNNNLTPIRKELLVDIDSKFNYSSYIDYNGRFKLIQNSNFSHNFTGDKGFTSISNRLKIVSASNTHHLLQDFNEKPLTLAVMQKLHKQMQVTCLSKQSNYSNEEDLIRRRIKPCAGLCLYDLWEDPCEYFDVSKLYPHVVRSMWRKVNELSLHVKLKPSLTFDENADPKFCNRTWFNWLDDDGFAAPEIMQPTMIVMVLALFVSLANCTLSDSELKHVQNTWLDVYKNMLTKFDINVPDDSKAKEVIETLLSDPHLQHAVQLVNALWNNVKIRSF